MSDDLPAPQNSALASCSYIEQLYVTEFLRDLDARAARMRLRMRYADYQRCRKSPIVKAAIQEAISARNYRVQVGADDVLRLLVEEIHQLRNADLSELYQDGKLLPVSEWPDEWRRGLVEGIEQESMWQRSEDGTDAEKKGGWDIAGKLVKVKLAGRKKLLLQALELLGRHVGVQAFPQAGDKLGAGLTDLAAAIDRGISEGRQRAARRVSEGYAYVSKKRD